MSTEPRTRQHRHNQPNKGTPKMKKLLIAALALAALAPVAQAASVTFTFSFTAPPSTAITLAQLAGSPCTVNAVALTMSCSLPLAAGQQLATIVVSPAGWQGGVGISAGSPFAIGGATPNYILTSAAALTVPPSGPVTFTITSTP